MKQQAKQASDNGVNEMRQSTNGAVEKMRAQMKEKMMRIIDTKYKQYIVIYSGIEFKLVDFIANARTNDQTHRREIQALDRDLEQNCIQTCGIHCKCKNK